MLWLNLIPKTISFLKSQVGRFLLCGILVLGLWLLASSWYSSQLQKEYKKGYDAAVIEYQGAVIEAQAELNKELAVARSKIEKDLAGIRSTTSKTLKEIQNVPSPCADIGVAPVGLLNEQISAGNSGLSVH